VTYSGWGKTRTVKCCVSDLGWKNKKARTIDVLRKTINNITGREEIKTLNTEWEGGRRIPSPPFKVTDREKTKNR